MKPEYIVTYNSWQDSASGDGFFKAITKICPTAKILNTELCELKDLHKKFGDEFYNDIKVYKCEEIPVPRVKIAARRSTK